MTREEDPMPTFKEFLHVAEITLSDKTSTKRMEEIISVLRQYQVTKGLTPEKAVDILEALGPTYVKIGQMASTRSDILPEQYCQAFEKLHADVSPLPFRTIEDCLNKAYGVPWQMIFAQIDPTPLGSASIAQVHKAVLHDNSVVAIKVRRPGIVEEMAEDITLMKHVLALAEFSITSHESIMLTMQNLVDELARTTADELDFTVELNNLVRFYNENKDQKGVSSPIPYPRYSGDDVLVMEYVEGIPIDDTKRLEAEGIDLKYLAQRLVQNFIYQVLDQGFFHADPHPGNILVRDKEIVWIDLGMTGTLSKNDRVLVSKLFHAVATDNAYELKEGVLALCTTNGEIDHGKLLSAMSSLLQKYGQADLAEINVGEVFGEILTVLRTQNLVMKPTITMLVRGVMTLEGVLADIAPSVSVLKIVSVHVIKEEISPKNIESRLIDAFTSTTESVEALTRLPLQVSDTLDMLDQGQMSVRSDLKLSVDSLAALYTMCGRLALALISVGLFLGSSILCTTNMEPRFLEVPILGVLGYLGAFILGVYVIWRVFATRHKMHNKENLD